MVKKKNQKITLFLLFIVIILTILVSKSVNAILFEEDTTFSEGNIDYVFKEGIELDSFEITSGGIRINGDEKLGIDIKGGHLTLTFYEFYKLSKDIGIKSSVPQIISFEITSDGSRQYLYDGDSYYLNEYTISANKEVRFKYVNFKDDLESNGLVIQNIEELSFLNKKFAEFETKSNRDNGIITTVNKLTITYLNLAIILVSIVGLFMLYRGLKK